MNLYMDRKKEKRARLYREIGGYILAVLLGFLLSFAFIFFLFQTANVAGDSMAPSLNDGERILLERCAYTITSPKRYDIVKFRIKKSDAEHDYIKRIVALPKETVQIKDGKLYVNQKEVKNLPFEDEIASEGIAAEEVTLDDNEYFMLGDNVNNSEDSRFTNVGVITKDELEGKVIATLNGIHIHRVK